MELRYVDLDARLDAVQDRFWQCDASMRERWAEVSRTAWLYHELQLEGVAVRPDDLQRARAQEEGADYCDRVLLDQIRRAEQTLRAVNDHAFVGGALSLADLRGWVATLNAEELDVSFRKKDGPTEHYKHDVLDPKDIVDALDALLERTASEEAAHPLERAFELLYEIGKIWPFSQWSGMCARLAASAVLIRSGYPELIIPTRERMRFYQAYHYEPSRMKDLFLESVEGILTLKDAFIDGREDAQMLWPVSENPSAR